MHTQTAITIIAFGKDVSYKCVLHCLFIFCYGNTWTIQVQNVHKHNHNNTTIVYILGNIVNSLACTKPHFHIDLIFTDKFPSFKCHLLDSGCASSTAVVDAAVTTVTVLISVAVVVSTSATVGRATKCGHVEISANSRSPGHSVGRVCRWPSSM